MNQTLKNAQLADFVAEQSGSSRGIVVAVWLWAVAVLTGAATLLNYSFTEGAATDILRHRPKDRTVDHSNPSESEFDVYVFVHPRCPCSRATVEQLNPITRNSASEANINVSFYCPTGKPDSWAQGELWDSAAKNDRLNCSVDRAGRRAAEFGVNTSGHVVAFDRDGRRIFSGGITASRGHEGVCLGSELLTEICFGREITPTELPVFGCAITDELDSGNGGTR